MNPKAHKAIREILDQSGAFLPNRRLDGYTLLILWENCDAGQFTLNDLDAVSSQLCTLIKEFAPVFREYQRNNPPPMTQDNQEVAWSRWELNRITWVEEFIGENLPITDYLKEFTAAEMIAAIGAGFLFALDQFGIWRNGEQTIGAMETPISEAFDKFVNSPDADRLLAEYETKRGGK